MFHLDSFSLFSVVTSWHSWFLLVLGFITRDDEFRRKVGLCLVLSWLLSLLCRQVLTLMVPSRLGFISSGDWAMTSD